MQRKREEEKKREARKWNEVPSAGMNLKYQAELKDTQDEKERKISSEKVDDSCS